MLTQEKLKELFNYNPETGVLTQRIRTSMRVKVGDVVGMIRKDGYIQTEINGKAYLCHRLIWMYVYGNFPKFSIDHKDGNPSNNNINNLRDCSISNNCKNRHIKKNKYNRIFWRIF